MWPVDNDSGSVQSRTRVGDMAMGMEIDSNDGQTKISTADSQSGKRTAPMARIQDRCPISFVHICLIGVYTPGPLIVQFGGSHTPEHSASN